VKGRIASLLEVGTGFHPDLTGRENIFLNGAILGMTKSEIRKKFDEIVAFAEIEKFIDTPVKRYSSGMYVRLAFAVAAHLEPEILIVDEVLAVGDAAFQKKCLGKMENLACQEGRTVLFVSHNLGAISNLCHRCILLNQGTIAANAETRHALSCYLDLGLRQSAERRWLEASAAPGNSNVRLLAVCVLSRGRASQEVMIDEPVEVQIEYETQREGLELSTSLHVLHSVGGEVLSTANFPSATLGRDEWFGKRLPKGRFRSNCIFPANFFNEGTYALNVILLNRARSIELFEREVIAFHVRETGAMRAEWTGDWIGVVRPRFAWRTEHLASA
jgi:lipopolysaccharide transport system ATP-binding protein